MVLLMLQLLLQLLPLLPLLLPPTILAGTFENISTGRCRHVPTPTSILSESRGYIAPTLATGLGKKYLG